MILYIGFRSDRQDLGFECVKDSEAGNIVFEIGLIYFGITIFVNSSLFINDQDLNDQFYLDKMSQERLVAGISNQDLSIQPVNVRNGINSKNLIDGLRGGSDNLPENNGPSLDKIRDTLQESVKSDKLQESILSKVKGFENFNQKSLNKIIIQFIDKMEPIIGNQNFLRVLAETQTPLKPELRISVEQKPSSPISAKDNSNLQPKKNSAKGGSFLFVNGALAPLNPHRWPAYVAGSAMSAQTGQPGKSDMATQLTFEQKLKTPLDNLNVMKEYLETAKSDSQWRGRFWQVLDDIQKVNLASELGGDVGAFAAGAAANTIANSYVREMIDTGWDQTPQEKLNLQIFKQTAREQGVDTSEVYGTGLMREFVPPFMKEDICIRPEKNPSPGFLKDSSSPSEDQSSFN